MSFRQKRINIFLVNMHVGGSDNAPPTPCPRSAYVSACAAAYASRTERPERGEKGKMGVVGQGMGKRSFLLRSAGL
jgi:hypothetical protein